MPKLPDDPNLYNLDALSAPRDPSQDSLRAAAMESTSAFEAAREAALSPYASLRAAAEASAAKFSSAFAAARDPMTSTLRREAARVAAMMGDAREREPRTAAEAAAWAFTDARERRSLLAIGAPPPGGVHYDALRIGIDPDYRAEVYRLRRASPAEINAHNLREESRRRNDARRMRDAREARLTTERNDLLQQINEGLRAELATIGGPRGLRELQDTRRALEHAGLIRREAPAPSALRAAMEAPPPAPPPAPSPPSQSPEEIERQKRKERAARRGEELRALAPRTLLSCLRPLLKRRSPAKVAGDYGMTADELRELMERARRATTPQRRHRKRG